MVIIKFKNRRSNKKQKTSSQNSKQSSTSSLVSSSGTEQPGQGASLLGWPKSIYYLEDGRHLVRLRHRAYAPTSNTASHDQHEKINSWVSFSFLFEYGAPLGGPSGRRSSAIKCVEKCIECFSTRWKRFLEGWKTLKAFFNAFSTHFWLISYAGISQIGSHTD